MLGRILDSVLEGETSFRVWQGMEEFPKRNMEIRASEMKKMKEQ